MTTQPQTIPPPRCADGPCEDPVGEDGVHCTRHAAENAKRYAEALNP